ncbi:MAG: glycine cleavage T C-terminal barrel domain-containing protein, partial [Alphaproteobacteria bacterium]|nr:glycine cleavage T C-terminal barrel domain-containing protein [Alphaproteobacteria bacterium]
VGKVTSAVYSPRLDKNIALAMVSADYVTLGTQLEIYADGVKLDAMVVEKPFYDPSKSVAAASIAVA